MSKTQPHLALSHTIWSHQNDETGISQRSYEHTGAGVAGSVDALLAPQLPLVPRAARRYARVQASGVSASGGFRGFVFRLRGFRVQGAGVGVEHLGFGGWGFSANSYSSIQEFWKDLVCRV